MGRWPYEGSELVIFQGVLRRPEVVKELMNLKELPWGEGVSGQRVSDCRSRGNYAMQMFIFQIVYGPFHGNKTLAIFDRIGNKTTCKRPFRRRTPT